MVVDHGRQPWADHRAVGIEDHNVELGMIGLPCCVRPLGAMVMDQFISVTERGLAFMSKRQDGWVDLADDRMDARVGRRLQALFLRDLVDAAMNGRDREARPGTRIRAQIASEGGGATLPHPGNPTPGGAKWDAGGVGHLGQRGFAFDIGAQQREAFRSLRHAILYLVHEPPCPKRGRSPDGSPRLCQQAGKPAFAGELAVSFEWYYICCDNEAPYVTSSRMANILIGYARCSTDRQDLAAQKGALLALGVAADRIYTDHGFTGATRARPGLDQALAAVRSGDMLVVPKLDRLARSVPDARAIGDDLAARGVRLQIGASVHDPADPMGKLFFNILATFAEFEADLIRMRTREGMALARSRGKLRGKKPKLSERQQKELRRMYDAGDYSVSDLAEVFSVSRPTVYRTLGRQVSGADAE